jgi:putative ABC transport system permease protein
MRTPLAWLNLAHFKMRTLAALAGVAFSVVLIFMQLGFLGSVETTATLLYDAVEFDLLIRSPQYLHMAAAGGFPRQRLYQAASMPGLRSVRPMWVGTSRWRNLKTGQSRRILTLGLSPEEDVFTLDELREKAALLVAPEFVLIDRRSRHEFGPNNGKSFGDADVGTYGELGGQRVEIVGHYALGVGFAADGSVVLNERGFRRITEGMPADHVSMGLIRLADGADPREVAARLDGILPDDAEVLTRDQVEERELKHWVRETSVGVIFQLGVVVALIVGTAIVYQVLSSDVTNHLAEYATLKAMGYSNAFVAAVVLRQAVALALLGFVPGFLFSEVLYEFTAAAASIPIAMTQRRIAAVLVLAVGMCTISGLGAVRKLRSADPADLF